MLRFNIVVIFGFLCQIGNAQESFLPQTEFLETQKYSVQEKIQEVYGTSFFENNNGTYKLLENLLEQRISYQFYDEDHAQKLENIINISELPLMNKLNSSILPFDNATFTFDNFNPLRYQVELFDPVNVHMYIIGQTNYILVIQPQSNF